MKRVFFFSICFFLMVFQLASTASNDTRVEKLNYTSRNGQEIKVEIAITKPKATDPIKYIDVWGYDQFYSMFSEKNRYVPPENAITNIKVTYNNKNISVPLSSYCDLTNYRKMKIEELIDCRTFVLTIEGGGAAFSYIAEIYFDDFFVRKRIVRSSCFPESSREETFYTANEWDI